MDIIAPPFVCDHESDGLPIVHPNDWSANEFSVDYKPLGLTFLMCHRKLEQHELPMSATACLVAHKEVKPLSPLRLLRELGKTAIQVYALYDRGEWYGAHVAYPPVARRGDDPGDDIPFDASGPVPCSTRTVDRPESCAEGAGDILQLDLFDAPSTVRPSHAKALSAVENPKA